MHRRDYDCRLWRRELKKAVRNTIFFAAFLSGVVLRAGRSGADVRKANLVRNIEKGEKIDDIINEAKYITFADDVEVALIQLDDGTRQLVSGGRHGIELPAVSAGAPLAQ